LEHDSDVVAVVKVDENLDDGGMWNARSAGAAAASTPKNGGCLDVIFEEDDDDDDVVVDNGDDAVDDDAADEMMMDRRAATIMAQADVVVQQQVDVLLIQLVLLRLLRTLIMILSHASYWETSITAAIETDGVRCVLFVSEESCTCAEQWTDDDRRRRGDNINIAWRRLQLSDNVT
jgi:hypothetical protein